MTDKTNPKEEGNYLRRINLSKRDIIRWIIKSGEMTISEVMKRNGIELPQMIRILKSQKSDTRFLTRNLIRQGVIKKLPCEICDKNKSDGHHIDYEFPLEIIWLCRKHHKAFHRQFRSDGLGFVPMFSTLGIN
jgi:hypothetical protein